MQSDVTPVDQLTIVTCHFNPFRYCSPARNYWQFRQSLGEGLSGLLITIELSFDGHYMVHDSIRVRGGPENLMWQKEALLNVAFRHIPKDAGYVAWIDHDVIFQERDWALRAVQRLSDDDAVIQLFDHVDYQDQHGEVVQSSPSSLWNWTANRKAVGTPGMAWAARRDYLEACGGLPAANIIGGGDIPAFNGFSDCDSEYYKRQCNDSLNRRNQQWIEQARRSRGKLKFGALSGRVRHLWHGGHEDRQYASRAEIIRDCDVEHDIRLNRDGIWEWSCPKPLLHQRVRDYFGNRREDGVTPVAAATVPPPAPPAIQSFRSDRHAGEDAEGSAGSCVHFVTTLDGDHVPGLLALLGSLRERSGIRYRFTVLLYSNLSTVELDRIRRMEVDAEFLDIHSLGKFPVPKHGSRHSRLEPNFQKCLVWRLPYQGSCVYIDADVLCLNSLSGIEQWDTLTAASDPRVRTNREAYQLKDHVPWNAGIFGFRPDEEIYQGLCELSRSYSGQLKLGDQVIHNDYFSVKRPDLVRRVGMEWNMLVRYRVTHPAVFFEPSRIRLLHFAGSWKPWHTETPQAYRDFLREWQFYYDRALNGAGHAVHEVR